MTEVSDTTRDVHRKDRHRKEKEVLGERLVRAEEELEEHRIKGYANEDALHDLEAQEEELEKLVEQLDTQLAAL